MQLIEQKLEPQLLFTFRENSNNYLVIETRAQHGQHDLSIHILKNSSFPLKEMVKSTHKERQIERTPASMNTYAV